MPTTFYQRYSGIAGVAIIWLSVIIAMQQAGLELFDTRPISYLGTDPISIMLFSGGLLLSAVLFISFAYYVRRHYGVHNRFLAYFLIGQAGQIIAALVPYGEQSSYCLVHTIAAFTLAFSLPFLMRAFTHSQTGTVHYQLYRKLLYFELITFIVGIGIFTLTSGIAPLGQALPALGFHLWIIVLTFTSSR